MTGLVNGHAYAWKPTPRYCAESKDHHGHHTAAATISQQSINKNKTQNVRDRNRMISAWESGRVENNYT
jgi:hypothetical protein